MSRGFQGPALETVHKRPKSSITSVLVAFLAALTLVVSACSSPEEEAGAGAPIRVNTPMGQVTINGTPERIVTLGTQWTDVALAFGVTPVAYLDNVELLTKAPTPWVGDRLESSQAIDPSRDVASQVAALDPQLILSTNFGDQKETFAKLSKLAPTIPSITGKQVDPWQDMVTFMGTVLRQPEKAKEIIDGVNGKIDSVKQANPGLAGKSFALAWIVTGDQIMVFGDPSDGAATLFTSLGMTMAPKLLATFARSGEPRFPVSPENLPELEANMMVLAANSPALKTTMEGLPGYQNLTSVRSDAVAELSVAEVSGINQPSPLSLPFILDKMTPAFESAAK
jgi:iron complex transport system substrate-binding protein